MKAKQAWTITALLFIICSCGSGQNNPYGTNGTYGMMENEREFGVVVTVSQGISPTDVVSARAKDAANAAAAAGVRSSMSVMAPAYGNVLPQAAFTLGNGATAAVATIPQSLYTSASSEVMSQNEAVTLHYVIRKENGQVFALDQVPEDNEPINYPGNPVMIQRNGDYVRVYPANEENPLGYGQSDSSSPRSGYNTGPAIRARHR